MSPLIGYRLSSNGIGRNPTSWPSCFNPGCLATLLWAERLFRHKLLRVASRMYVAARRVYGFFSPLRSFFSSSRLMNERIIASDAFALKIVHEDRASAIFRRGRVVVSALAALVAAAAAAASIVPRRSS